MLGTSQVLLLLSFGRDDLKPEKPIGDQTFLKRFKLCRDSF
ncbi:hypothetical protein K035_2401 [Acinetobacter baumannii 42057_4]|nr:hypothetical protein J727_3273 [Acinetobacter baumannii 472237-120]EXR38869.1 hypothetical protein J668_1598 [Acinetobacter baumannii 1276470-86]KCW19949.1 hypothetical protein K035_2401 [Acinetobacter baumannii 42057_4]